MNQAEVIKTEEVGNNRRHWYPFLQFPYGETWLLFAQTWDKTTP